MSKDLMNFDNFNKPFFNNDFFEDLGKDIFTGFNQLAPNDGKANVINGTKDYKVSIELPGFKKDNIHLDYRHNTLSIIAKHDINKSNKDKKGQIIRQEYSTSNVARQFTLPNVIFNKITASYDGGILRVVLPKQHPAQNNSHNITIK